MNNNLLTNFSLDTNDCSPHNMLNICIFAELFTKIAFQRNLVKLIKEGPIREDKSKYRVHQCMRDKVKKNFFSFATR